MEGLPTNKQKGIEVSGININRGESGGSESGAPGATGGDSTSNSQDPDRSDISGVFIMNTKPEDRATSFFAQPGILAGNLFVLFFLNITSHRISLIFYLYF